MSSDAAPAVRWLARQSFVRNLDAGSLLESCLVSAVASLLVVRFYLALTGYPQIGGHGLHISHMLWGGLLMLAAIVLVLSFLGKHVLRTAAIVGGLGFGIFIDELGKFITSDNNYFFQPTIALIYIIFILLFLLFRELGERGRPSREEHLANAIDILREAVMHKLSEEQKGRAMSYLDASGEQGGVVAALRAALAQIDAVANPAPSFLVRVVAALSRFYLMLVRTPWYPRLLIAAFVVYILAQVSAVVAVVTTGTVTPRDLAALTFADWGMAVASATQTTLLIVGMTQLRRSRLAAYLWFKRAVLVSIFFVEVFAFYSEQLVALAGLVRDILILVALNAMIAAEQVKSEGAAADAARPSVVPLPHGVGGGQPGV